MTLREMKEQVMFQTNNDADDLEDFEPHINDYMNDGYDRLVFVWDHQHVLPGSEKYPPLTEDTDVPNVPEWMHRYLTDWATWLVYRNGNPQKQQRGLAFRESFLWLLSYVSDQGGADGLNEDGSTKQYKNFINIPV
jgi:hypothetical protein